ncbi:MAG: COX15/CtaA family protein [Anaerolineaceae bacterium]
MVRKNRFTYFSLFVLAYNVLVILIGAFVRATGSGSGCGAHWPTCNGELLPTSPIVETIIEFTHRATSGLSLILVFFLLVYTFRISMKGSFIRKAALSAFLFTILEALLGASLVLFQLVGENDSIARAIVISAHLLNTFMLLASLVLVYEWSKYTEPKKIKFSQINSAWLVLMTILILILGMSGAITALGDTLFPSSSLVEGLVQDTLNSAHFLIELRVYHPLLAILASVALILMVKFIVKIDADKRIIKRANLVITFFLFQLFLGGLNVVLLAPIWMQIIHLLFADLIWISYVMFINRLLIVDS